MEIIYETFYTNCSAPMAFLPGIHWWPMISPHKVTVPRKMFPSDDVIMSHKWPDNHTSMRRIGDMMLIEYMKVFSRIWKVSFIFQAANFPDENKLDSLKSHLTLLLAKEIGELLRNCFCSTFVSHSARFHNLFGFHIHATIHDINTHTYTHTYIYIYI